jgi:hypothetical protein
MVECQLPKLKVASSSLVTRSKTVQRRINICTKKSIAQIALTSSLLLMPAAVVAQTPNVDDAAPVSVLSFRWFKDKRAIELADTSPTMTPAPAMIAANKNFEKQRRINDPAGARDPNQDTLDGRSAELDRIVREARDAKPPVEGFTYHARIQNNSTKAVKSVFWEYRFKENANPANVARRQFVCTAKMKPEKTKDLEIFTLTAPTGVVSVGSLAKKSTKDFDESVIINRIEFEDGSAWQRKDWNFDEVKLTSKPPADSKTRMCRGL